MQRELLAANLVLGNGFPGMSAIYPRSTNQCLGTGQMVKN